MALLDLIGALGGSDRSRASQLLRKRRPAARPLPVVTQRPTALGGFTRRRPKERVRLMVFPEAARLTLDGGRPGDQRGFIHKKILGGISKIAGFAGSIGVPGATTVSRITGGLAGRRTLPRTQTARVTLFSQEEKNRGRFSKFPDLGPIAFAPRGFVPRDVEGGCADPALVMAPDGHCVARGSGHYERHFGRGVGGTGVPVGDAVMGRYGAALAPGSLVIDRAVCLKGMQLADDGLCYNKSQISNKQRMWPAGRRPLLSGGDMRAISTAARAGKRLEGATKRLQRMGMMRKPTRRAVSTQHARLLEAHVTK